MAQKEDKTQKFYENYTNAAKKPKKTPQELYPLKDT
jgi:hypothetical protein